MGYYAQEFYELFGVGDQRKIYDVDVFAVLFAAIQALNTRSKELAEKMKLLEEESTVQSNVEMCKKVSSTPG